MRASSASVLVLTVVGTITAVLAGCLAPQPLPPQPGRLREFTVEAVEKDIEIYPGKTVHMWTFNGQVPGPLIRVTEGDHVLVHFFNNASQPHTMHFHGDHPYAMDGEDHQAVPPGGNFTYDFIAGPAGAYVYHCHVDTPVHIGMGLYGQFIVDPKAGWPGPQPDREFFAVFSDWNPRFNATAETYLLNGKAFPSTQTFHAEVGDRVRLFLSSLSEFPVAPHFHGSLPEEVWPARHPIDVVPLAHAETRVVDYLAKEPGAWMFHDHYETHLSNDGVYPGGSMSAIEVGPPWWGKFRELMAGMAGTSTGGTRGPNASPHTPASAVPPNATRVSIRDFDFDPPQLKVARGATVAWANEGSVAHTVTSDDATGPLSSGFLQPGEAYVLTFTVPGTYAYHCVPHSARSADGTYRGMVGTVLVG